MPDFPSKYETLRQNVAPEFTRLTDRQLEAELAGRGINAEMAEGFFDDLGRFALKAAPTILPMAGTLLGTVVGGPVGASIGGTLGRVAGSAISSATGGGGASASGPAPAPAPGPAPAPAPAAAPSGGAAAQLLQTVTRPETLQALMSMMMGQAGNPSVTVGSTPVPVSAFSNLLGVLANRAQAEYAEAAAAARAIPEYMTDYAGEAVGDPAVASHRAEALYGLLGRQDAMQSRGRFEAAEAYEAAEAADAADAEWADSEAEAEAWELLEYIESFDN